MEFTDLRQKLSCLKRRRSRTPDEQLPSRKYRERDRDRYKSHKKRRSRSSSRRRKKSKSRSRSRRRDIRSRSRSKHSRHSQSRSSSRSEDRRSKWKRRKRSRSNDMSWQDLNFTIPNPNCGNFSSSSSSPSPPRYETNSNYEVGKLRPNHSLGTFREQKRSILSEGKSIEECRAKIRQELESLKQQETMTKDPSCHSLIETIELESDDGDEYDEKNKITIPDLDVNVTEMEIRKSIFHQNWGIAEPSKISLTKFSGRCNAVLQFENEGAARQFKNQLGDQSSTSGLNHPTIPSPGVSPPRFMDNCEPIQVFDFDDPIPTIERSSTVVPIFVDIQSEDGSTIKKIKVHLYLHNKCQQFYGQEPKILISAFLNYMKKYFSSKEGMEFIFVTPCPASYTLFYSVLKENASNKQVFDYYFNNWADIQSIVKSIQQGSKVLYGSFHHENKETFKE